MRFFFLIFFATAVFPINRKHAECLDETSSVRATPRCVYMCVFEIQIVCVCVFIYTSEASQPAGRGSTKEDLPLPCLPASSLLGKKEEKDNDKVND